MIRFKSSDFIISGDLNYRVSNQNVEQAQWTSNRITRD